MFDLKQRAYFRLDKQKKNALRCAFFASYMRLCAILSFTVASLCVFRDTAQIRLDARPPATLFRYAGGMLPAVPAMLGTAYTLAASTFSFALLSLLADQHEGRERTFADVLNPLNGSRYLLFGLEKTAAVCRLLLLCFWPASITAALLTFLLRTGCPFLLLAGGLSVLAMQTLLCAAVFCVQYQQFSVAPYLLCKNPMLPVSEALLSSALLTEKKRFKLMLFRLRTLPLRLIAAPILPAPSARAILSALEATVSESIYDERNVETGSAAVVFYVGRDAVIKPAGPEAIDRKDSEN